MLHKVIYHIDWTKEGVLMYVSTMVKNIKGSIIKKYSNNMPIILKINAH